MSQGYRVTVTRQQGFSAGAEREPQLQAEQIGDTIEDRLGKTVDLTPYKLPGLTGMRVNKSYVHLLGDPHTLSQGYWRRKLYREEVRRVASSGGIRPISTGAHISYEQENHRGVAIQSKPILNTNVSYTLTIEFIEHEK